MLSQRANRVGRTGPGQVYRLYTKQEFEDASDDFNPAIHRQSLSKLVLDVLQHFPKRNIRELDLIEKPTVVAVHEAIQDLVILGCVTADRVVTPYGELVWGLGSPDPRLGVMMVQGGRVGTTSERLAICLAAVLTISQPALVLDEARLNSDFKTVVPIAYKSGDLEAYAETMATGYLDAEFEPAQPDFVGDPLIREVSVIAKDYARRLEKIRDDLEPPADREESEDTGSPMFRWICPALAGQAARWTPSRNQYIDMRTGVEVRVANDSVLRSVNDARTRATPGWYSALADPRPVICYFREEARRARRGGGRFYVVYHVFGEMETI